MNVPAASWSALDRQLRPYVRARLGAEADVDDVMQEILLRMHDGLGSLRDEERLVGWAYGIARRAIVDHRRARGRRPVPTDQPPELADTPTEETPASDELAPVIALFVAALPTPYREAITLTELEGMSQVDAARMLGISTTAMKSRVQRGRAKLRGLVERCCAIELDARNRVVGVVPRPDGWAPPAGCCDADEGCS